VIATPHLGFVTREEWELQFADVFDQVVAFAAGAPINVVNPKALEPRDPPAGAGRR
jgi:D-3-phosphoglycerate dehydrogenase